MNPLTKCCENVDNVMNTDDSFSEPYNFPRFPHPELITWSSDYNIVKPMTMSCKLSDNIMNTNDNAMQKRNSQGRKKWSTMPTTTLKRVSMFTSFMCEVHFHRVISAMNVPLLSLSPASPAKDNWQIAVQIQEYIPSCY